MTGAQLFELLRQFLLGGVGTLCFGMLFGIPRPCYWPAPPPAPWAG